MAKIQKKRLSKRTNRKCNFKKFVDSGYTNINAFLGACKNDENLLIYTCLTQDELKEYLTKMQEFETTDEQLKYLIDNQPTMNATIERYNRCVESIASYLKGYIQFNAFRMSNSDGDYEDWSSEFWAKYCKICEFYRTRWFYREKLTKPTTVVYSPMLYKEFIYICRMSITGERKHQAFLATQDQNASIFKISLDSKIETNKENDKTLADLMPDDEHDEAYMLSSVNVKHILEKALELCKQYPDANKNYSKIADFYDKQDTLGFDKKIVILGKIFLYKAGLISPKILTFIKSLSTTYKSRYNLSAALVNKQIVEYKKIKTGNTATTKLKTKKENLGWRELIFRKRGEL